MSRNVALLPVTVLHLRAAAAPGPCAEQGVTRVAPQRRPRTPQSTIPVGVRDGDNGTRTAHSRAHEPATCSTGSYTNTPRSHDVDNQFGTHKPDPVGNVPIDGRGAWSEHQPSAQKENEYIRQHDYSEYARCHLGIDDE